MYWIFGAIEELLPLIVFFVLERVYGFNEAVLGMVLSLACLFGATILFKRTAPRFAIGSTIAVLIFAGATLVTGDPVYFQFSDTLLEGVFGLVLLTGALRRRLLLKYFFERVFAIADEAWLLLTFRWGVLLTLVAIGNEFVRLTQTTDVWTFYKLLSTIGILLFGCYQFTVSIRYRIEGESNRLGLRVGGTIR